MNGNGREKKRIAKISHATRCTAAFAALGKIILKIFKEMMEKERDLRLRDLSRQHTLSRPVRKKPK